MNISTENLKAALAPVVPLAQVRHTVPILSMLRLSANNGQLEIQGSNLDVHAISKAECDGDLEPCCVSASALRYLTEAANGTVEFSTEKGRIVIKSGWASKLPTLLPDDFPPAPQPDTKPLGVNLEDLSNGIAGVMWASSRDDQRYLLMSVCVTLTGKEIICRGTDGKHFCLFAKPSICAKAEFMIPEAYTEYASRALKEPRAQITVGEKYAFINHDKGSCAIRLLEGVYPNTKHITDDAGKEIGKLDVAELIGHLNAMHSICVSDFCYGWMRFSKSGALLELADEKGLNEYKVTLLGKFSDCAIRIDVRRVLTVLKQVKSDIITLRYTEGNAIRFQDGDLDFILVVLNQNQTKAT